MDLSYDEALENSNGCQNSNEYHSATHFFDDMLDSDEDDVAEDMRTETAVNICPILVEMNRQSEMEQQEEKEKRDLADMKNLFIEELAIRLDENALRLNDAGNLESPTSPKEEDPIDIAQNELNATLPEPNIQANERSSPPLLTEGRNYSESKNMGTTNLQPKHKHRRNKVSTNDQDQRDRFLDAQKNLVLSMKEIESLEPCSLKKEEHCSNKINSNSSTAAPSVKIMTGTPGHNKEDDKRKNSNTDNDDEKKAAALERSLNAASYLLQNWGFKDRTSRNQMKEDLLNLENYGK